MANIYTDEKGHVICVLDIALDGNDFAEILGIDQSLAVDIILDAYEHLDNMLDEEISASAEFFLRNNPQFTPGLHQKADAPPMNEKVKGSTNAGRRKKKGGRRPHERGLFFEPHPRTKYLSSYRLLCDSEDAERQLEALLETP